LVVLVVLFLVMVSTFAFTPPDEFPHASTSKLRNISWMIIIGIGSFIILIMFVGSTPFTRLIVNSLGLSLPNSTIVVDELGESVVKGYGGSCVKVESNCSLEKVDILWARGKTYLLRLPIQSMVNHELKKEHQEILISRDRIVSIGRTRTAG